MTDRSIPENTPESQDKRCPRCEQVKPKSEFPRNKNRPGGVGSRCKKCDNELHKQHRKKHPEKAAEISRRHYQKYKEELKKERQENIEEIREQSRAFYRSNREKELARHKRYRIENKEKISKRRRAGSKRYYEQNRGKILAYHAVYRKTESGKRAHGRGAHKYRALKANAKSESFSPQSIFERDGYICQLCRKKTRPNYNQYHKLRPELDHIVPLSKGGDHTRKNTQCLCRECNERKHNTGKGDQLRMFG